MYPEYEWCVSGDYDPRFRPWYSTAATNPKIIVVVIDVSGSMGTANRITLAKEAALAVLNTLTWNDRVGFILFNHDVEDTYPITPCTDENRELMKTWATNNIEAGGATNFVAPLNEAFDMIETTSYTACTRTILFLTDGQATFYESDYDYVRNKAYANDIVIFTYGLGSGRCSFVTTKYDP